jgi:hypothetical protein
MLTHVGDDDEEQRILLADFGIARNVDDISGRLADHRPDRHRVVRRKRIRPARRRDDDRVRRLELPQRRTVQPKALIR